MGLSLNLWTIGYARNPIDMCPLKKKGLVMKIWHIALKFDYLLVFSCRLPT